MQASTNQFDYISHPALVSIIHNTTVIPSSYRKQIPEANFSNIGPLTSNEIIKFSLIRNYTNLKAWLCSCQRFLLNCNLERRGTHLIPNRIDVL